MTTDIHEHLSSLASAIADPSRAKILCGLMDGRAYTATELSTIAEISPSTTSSHLAKLTAQGFIRQIKQGRYRYFCLMAGELGKQLLIFLETQKWLNRCPQTREITWITEGQSMLKKYFNIEFPD